MTRSTALARTVVATCAVALALAAYGSSSADTAAGTSTTTRHRPDFARAVDVGGGRQIYAECRGHGSPTVLLIAGKGNGAEDWLQVLDAKDPEHDAAGDNLPWGKGKLHRSPRAVFPAVARFTRVCTYDRPDVRIDGADLTTPRAQPHTLDLDVDDLQSLLTALGEPGPYVLVAHSYGGLIATLYARTHPESVAGLVMVDTVSELMAKVATPGQLASWNATNAATSPQSREGVQLIDAFARINAAGPLPKVPAVVLSADKPWRLDLVPAEARQGEQVTFDNWLAELDHLGTALDAEHITKTNSGHDIYLYSPKLVVGAIHEVVDDARSTSK